MLNELDEFRAYTQQPVYTSSGKRDTSYLGRFTFDMLLDFEGLARVLTILARGYSWQADKPDVDRARRALCAWCSVPDSKKASPREDWQYRTDFRDLQNEFPELVDGNGCGWFCRHIHGICDFVKANPTITGKTAQDNCAKLKDFDTAWRNKVKQLQAPIFSSGTKGAWVLRFDDIFADALELGLLRDNTVSFSAEKQKRIAALAPDGVPPEVLQTLIAYYIANKPEDTDWVVLPVVNFDAYFGNTNFSRKWLNKIPESIIVRQKQSFGVCRFIVSNAVLDIIFS